MRSLKWIFWAKIKHDNCISSGHSRGESVSLSSLLSLVSLFSSGHLHALIWAPSCLFKVLLTNLCFHLHISSLLLTFLSPPYKDSYDYIEPIQLFQDNLKSSVSRINSLLQSVFYPSGNVLTGSWDYDVDIFEGAIFQPTKVRFSLSTVFDDIVDSSKIYSPTFHLIPLKPRTLINWVCQKSHLDIDGAQCSIYSTPLFSHYNATLSYIRVFVQAGYLCVECPSFFPNCW